MYGLRRAFVVSSTSFVSAVPCPPILEDLDVIAVAATE
jgi:hypothetical protein